MLNGGSHKDQHTVTHVSESSRCQLFIGQFCHCLVVRVECTLLGNVLHHDRPAFQRQVTMVSHGDDGLFKDATHPEAGIR